MRRARSLARRLVARALPMAAAAVLPVAGLVACSDSRFAEPFVAQRVVAFGDEFSVITTEGRKYSVNAFTDGNPDCAKNAIWVQDIATAYAKPFPNCAPAGANAPSVSRAVPGATAEGLVQQVDAHVATDRFAEKDLVTIFVGLHDVVGEYAKLATDGEAAVAARLGAAGKLLGTQVNRVARSGPPVLIVTIPNLALTPFGIAEEAANPGRAAVLQRLTVAFNTAMRLEIINDGSMIGLVDAYDLLGAMVKFAGSFGIADATRPACLATAALPDCNTSTVIEANGAAVNAANFLWADRLHFGPTAHRQLGTLGSARSRNNPF